MAVTVTPPGTAAQPLNSPDHATWAGQVYNDLRSLDTAAAAAASRSTLGNLLTDNQASGTDTLGTTADFTTYRFTIASSTLYPVQGSRTLACTTTTTVDEYLDLSARLNVEAGDVYTMAATVARSSVAESVRLRIDWYNVASGGTALGTTLGALQTSSTVGALTLSVTAAAPPGATYARPEFVRNAGAVGSVHYVDCLGFWKGAGGQWSMPGTPITNLGIQTGTDGVTQAWDTVSAAWVNVENGWETVATWSALPATGNWAGRQIAVADGLKAAGAVGLVAVWSGTAWTVDPVSDTGWWTYTTLLVNGWAESLAGSAQIRRRGAEVRISSRLNGATATAPTAATLPVGWRASGSDQAVVTVSGLVSTVVVETTSGGGIVLWQGNGKTGIQYLNTTYLTANAWPTAAP